jgi:hypothetical protein
VDEGPVCEEKKQASVSLFLIIVGLFRGLLGIFCGATGLCSGIPELTLHGVWLTGGSTGCGYTYLPCT